MEQLPSFHSAVAHARGALRQVNDATIRQTLGRHRRPIVDVDTTFSTFPSPPESLLSEISGTIQLRLTDPTDSDRSSLVGCLPNMNDQVKWVPDNLDRISPPIPDPEDDEEVFRKLIHDVETYIPGTTDKLGTIRCYVVDLAKMRQSGYDFAVGCDRGSLSEYLSSILCPRGHPRFRDHGAVKADRLLMMDHIALKPEYQGIGLELLLTSHLISNPRGVPMDLTILRLESTTPPPFCARHIPPVDVGTPSDLYAGTRRYWARLGSEEWPAALGYRGRAVWGLVLQDIQAEHGIRRHLPHFYGSSPHVERALSPSLKYLTLRNETPPPAFKRRARLQVLDEESDHAPNRDVPRSPAPSYSSPLARKSNGDVWLTTPEAIRQAVRILSTQSLPPTSIPSLAPINQLTHHQAEVANTRLYLHTQGFSPAINDIARLRIARTVVDSPIVERVDRGVGSASSQPLISRIPVPVHRDPLVRFDRARTNLSRVQTGRSPVAAGYAGQIVLHPASGLIAQSQSPVPSQTRRGIAQARRMTMPQRSNENAVPDYDHHRSAYGNVPRTRHQEAACNTEPTGQFRSERLAARIPLAPARHLQSTAASRARSRS